MSKLIFKWLFLWLVPLLVVIAFLILLPGCSRKTTQVFTQNDSVAVRTEYRDRLIQQVDTFKDIQNNYVFVKGDTMVIYRDRYRDRFRDRVDTCFIELTDTCYIDRINTEIRTKEVKVIKWWEWLILGILAINIYFAFKRK